MDEVEKRVLSRLRQQLVKEMVVTESFLSAFCQSDLLDEHLASGIRAETNFEKRASKLLETLPSQSSKAFFTLMEILEITNPWLSEKMKAALHDERTRDAKINIHPSVAKSASIEGFGHSRLHIDTDIKERASKFVQSNLYHLTEAEQRGVEKWMADELQRDRRRQQFRAPHESRRQRGDFHSSKETQTDTCTLDLREMFDELSIYLHGVDYDEQELSFGLIQREVKELLARTKKLDNLFLNCWNKFDDTEKYSQNLPELIERLVRHEKRLMATEELNKQMMNKSKDERDNLKRRVRRLEDDIESLLQRQANVIPQQELQLRHRNSVHMRYTFPYPADSNLMTIDNEDANQVVSRTDNQHVQEGSKPKPTNASTTSHLAAVTGTPSDENHRENNTSSSNHSPDHQNVVRNKPNTTTKTQTGNSKTMHDTTHNDRVNGAGGHIYRAEPIHFEEKRITTTNGHHSQERNNTNTYGMREQVPTNNTNKNKNVSIGRSVSFNAERDKKKTEKNIINKSNTGYHKDIGVGGKLRRHASEESLRIAVSREEMNSSSTSSLNSDSCQPQKLSVEDLPTAVEQQGKYPIPKQQNRVTRVDLQSRMQRMIAIRSQNVKDTKPQQPRDSGISTNNTKLQSTNQCTNARSMNNSDTSPATTGKSSLQSSYEAIHNSKTRDKSPNINPTRSQVTAKAQNNHQQTQNHIQQQQQQQLNGQQDQQGLFLLANRYNKSAVTQDEAKREQIERYVQLGHPYRSFSSERLYRADKGHSPIRSNVHVNPQTTPFQNSHHQPGEYSSDSELVLKPSSLRQKTTRSNKWTGSRSVRFANPIAKTTHPHRKGNGRGGGSQVRSRYQMDTTSTAQKKIQK